MGNAELERLANDQVEDLLDIYAEARLTPTSPVLARMRARVLAEARATAAAREAATAPLLAPSLEPAGSRFAWLQSPLPRRALALGMAASLTLGTTAAVLAAPPGSPFYNARLVIETALMPGFKDIDARLAAYEEQFADRLAEAEAALARGDTAALAAALAAYQDEVAHALVDIGDADARLARLEAVLARHIAKLEELAERLPTAVSRENAVEHAIAASERAVDRINQEQAEGRPDPAGNPHPSAGPHQPASPKPNLNPGGNGGQGGNAGGGTP